MLSSGQIPGNFSPNFDVLMCLILCQPYKSKVPSMWALILI